MSLAVAGCLGDTASPHLPRPAALSVAPVFAGRAASVVSFDLVRVTLSRSSGIALDTTIPFPPNADTLALKLDVPITGASEVLSLKLALVNALGDTVFRGGPTPVTVSTTIGIPQAASVPLRYVGVGANAKSMRIVPDTTAVFFADSVALTATALDSSGQPIPGTPIAWRSLDTTLAKVRSDTSGTVLAGNARGVGAIEASLPTGLADTARIVVEPRPAALSVVSGNAQTGPVGAALPQPLVVRVTAADSLGVAGVPVAWSVTGGGGTVAAGVDTTDATGNASAVWTLGGAVGTQTLSATVVGSPSLTATVSATALVGAARKLAFQVQPAGGPANVALAPPVQVVAQDSFGNTATTFTGNVTVAIGANPGGATLGGTLTVAASAGVATFSSLTLNLAGTGYTLTASAAGLTGATSAPFAISGGIPIQLAFTQQPSNVAAGASIAPAVTVSVLDANGNLVLNATTAVTVAITSGTGKAGATLLGTTTATPVAGVATFSALSIDSAGTGYTLTATATGLASATSSAFTVAAGAAAALAFSTQPPASTTYQTAFGFTVTARDAYGNTVTSFASPVTVAIGTNPAGGTLSGTLTATAASGVAAFSGVSIDNVGTGYTLTASATGLTAGTSAAFNIVAPAGVNAWLPITGGNWSVAGNWSKGAVPVATDTVVIQQSGTYTVTLDVPTGTYAQLRVGGPSGAQTLSVAADTLAGGNATFSTRGTLALSGTGVIVGPGTLSIAGAFNWTGGSLGAPGKSWGAVQVLAGGTLGIANTTNVQLQNYTLALAGTGTWTGTAFINSGNNDTLRVLPGGVLTVSGAPSYSLNLGGATLFDNQGTVIHNTSASSFVVNVPITGAGAWQVQTGSINLQLGGTVGGAVTVASGATLNFFLGGNTLTFGPTSSISGAGAVAVHSGFARITGTYNLSGVTTLDTGSVVFAGATGTAGGLTLVSGAASLSDSAGALTFAGPTTWISGGIQVQAGTLTLSGGSGATFLGTASVATGATLQLAGGTFTQTGAMAVSGGTLLVSGGLLVPNGHALGVTGAFSTSGTGALQETVATDSVDVGGNATFGGGAGTLSSGVLRVSGNFTQSGSPNSFAPTGTFVTLGGGATQTLAFSDATNSFFRRLTVNKTGGGVVLGTNVRASFFRLLSSTAVTGPTARLLTDTIYSPLTFGPSVTPLVVEITSVLGDSSAATFSPDTTVFTGTNQVIPFSLTSIFAYKSVRVAQAATGIATLQGRLALPNDLVVSSGGLQLSRFTAAVTGNFLTQGSGYLVMASPTDSLLVAGNATFAGGSTAGKLTSGVITVGGNFAQAGDTSAYVPLAGSVHRLVLNGAGAQAISFANPATSWFNTLEVASTATRTVTLQTNALVKDTMYVDGGASQTTLNGAGTSQRLTVYGPLNVTQSTLSPKVTPPVLELQSAPVIGGAPVLVSPDTMVLSGGITTLPTGSGIVYKSLRVNVSGSAITSPGGVTYNGDLIVSAGWYTMGAGRDSVGGFFRTEGTGALEMYGSVAAPTLAVRDSAVFAGASEIDLLASGYLQLYGSFVQRADSVGFVALPLFTTVFAGSGTQTVTFANPGATTSRFGNLAIERAVSGVSQSAGISLGSNVYVAGNLEDSTSYTGATDSIAGNGFAVTAAGLSLGSQFVLNDAPLVTNAGTLLLGALTFRNMPPAATQWTMNLAPNANGYFLTGLNFAPTTFTTGGQYFAALLNATGVPTNLTVTSALPAAAALSGHYTRTNTNGSVTVSWNGTPLP